MATSAKVILIEGCSYHRGDRKFFKDKPVTLHDMDEINFYKNRRDFNVVMSIAPSALEQSSEDELDDETDDESQESTEMTKSQLESMKKKKLMILGAEYGLFFKGDELKKSMIEDIMEAQDE